MDADAIILWIDNTASLHKFKESIEKNMALKKARGVYVEGLAPKAFSWVVEAAAKELAKAEGDGRPWHIQIPKHERDLAAKELARRFEGKWAIPVERERLSMSLPKKYQPKTMPATKAQEKRVRKFFDDKARKPLPKKLMTRAEYMANPSPAAHRRYYGQFVMPSVLQLVESRIGIERILESKDRHFNDIPLERWDRLVNSLPSATWAMLDEAGDRGAQLGSGVPILKEAARQLKAAAYGRGSPSIAKHERGDNPKISSRVSSRSLVARVGRVLGKKGRVI